MQGRLNTRNPQERDTTVTSLQRFLTGKHPSTPVLDFTFKVFLAVIATSLIKQFLRRGTCPSTGHARHAAGTTQRLLVRTRTCVSGQLTTHTDIPFSSFQIVNGANVIQATAGHVVPRRGVCTGHDPRRTQRDGMDLRDRTYVMQRAQLLKLI